MLAGGLVFLLGSKILLSPLQQRSLEVAGLLLIVLTIAIYNKDTAWPGWRALLPVVASAMVLLANHNSFLTTSRLTQWLGDRSYSLYLWHWPLAVALTYFSLNNSPIAIASALLLTGLFGHLSYLWIENTSREWFARQHLGLTVGSLVVAVVGVALPAVGVWKQQGVAGRFEPALEFAAAEGNNHNLRRGECHPNKGASSPSCVYGGTTRQVILVGDSHADAVVTAFADANGLKDAGVVQWSYNACNFVLGMKIVERNSFLSNSDYKCEKFIAWVSTQLLTVDSSIPIVIMNRYAAAAMGANESANRQDQPGVFFTKVYAQTSPTFLAEFSAQITNTACDLAKHRSVYMIRPIPEMGFDVPKTLSRLMLFGKNNDLFISIEEYQKRNAWVWTAQDAARDKCGVKILDPIPYLCKSGRCYGSQNGRPLYTDDDHLSEFGNKLLVPMFAEVFKTL
jgi:hypothetical protein